MQEKKGQNMQQRAQGGTDAGNCSAKKGRTRGVGTTDPLPTIGRLISSIYLKKILF
jgi:hypothetical protein